MVERVAVKGSLSEKLLSENKVNCGKAKLLSMLIRSQALNREGSETIPTGSTILEQDGKRLAPPSQEKGDDIVHAAMKIGEYV